MADMEYPATSDYSSQPFAVNELFIYLEGSGIWTLGDTTFEINKGDIVLIPRDIPRKNYIAIALEPITYVNAYFSCEDIKLDRPKIFRLNSDALTSQFLKLGRVWLAKKENYYAKSMALLYDIIGDIQALSSNYMPQKKTAALEKSSEYLEANYYKKNFDYAYMAALSGLSYSYFKKLFISKYGSSPVKHVTNLRINLACELIQSEKYAIGTVAEMCGFEDVYYFSKTFKRITGVAPSKFRK